VERDELPRIERELDKLMKLILASDDIDASKRVMKQMKELETRKEDLEKALAEAVEPPPLLHPNMAEIYRQRVTALYENLRDEDGKVEAAAVFRTLVNEAMLVPDAQELAIVLRGDLAAILRFAANKKNPDVLSEAGVLGALLSQESLVAGIGFEPMTFRL
jgi:site-specific DNA recombinase